MSTDSVASDRCGIYCRVSGPGQSTVPEQERLSRQTAERHGWVVVEVVTDDGLSGDDEDRPGLARLLALFRDHQRAGCPINRLLLAHTDRLSRSDTIETFALLRDLRRAGLRWVVTSQRTYDLRSKMDRSLWGLEQDLASNPFLAMNAERSLDGMAEVARAGFWVGRVPLGYALEKRPGRHGGKRRRSGVLVIDPKTAPLVAELFSRYVRGESTTTLAGWLSGECKPPRAARWSAQTVRQLLLNRTYEGTRVFGQRSRGKHVRLDEGAKAAPIDSDEPRQKKGPTAAIVLQGAVPAIVSAELFAAAGERLRGGRRRAFRKTAPPLPLAGLGKCGGCGGPLHAIHAHVRHRSGNRTRVRRLICGQRHRYGATTCPAGSTGASHDRVLKTILAEVADRMLADGAIERLAALAADQADDTQRRRQQAREAGLRRLAALDAAITTGQERILSAPPDLVDDYHAGIRRARAQRNELQAELDREERTPAPPALDPERFRAFLHVCKKAQAIVARGGAYPPHLRDLVAEMIEGFTVQFCPDARGRATLDGVEIVLPDWLRAIAQLAGSGCLPDKLCIVVPILP